MMLSSTINKICVVLSIACIGLAYILAGYWLILPVLLVMLLAWLLQKKQSAFWPACTLLMLYVLLAIVGIVLRLPVLLLAAGCSAALACWDLTLFQQSVARDQTAEMNMRLERLHLRSLGMAASLGLLFTFLGLSFNLQLPFIVIMSLALIAVGCLTYGLHSILKKSD